MAPATHSENAALFSQLRTLAMTFPLQLLAAIIVLRLVWNKFQRRLVSIPGPPVAAYTKF
ncbi:hypothetical protein PV08_02258 [Exophiala spinifera]|uniref:Uncharacterized protein n=1 Tax=Exophiala spinifera TaxID=91928 RepID=A0A0D2BRH7_9EURO|nr:uncharacterized protein PV08_02258 [Exophiala spinifera]KIW21678.1 hypothetical protein PV08_02258 [Exophiala spinifera]